MPVSDAQFAQWLKSDNSNRVALVQIDYMAEGGSPEGPVTETVRISDKEYFGDTAGPYNVALASVPNYSRSLSGDRLGIYQQTLGAVEIFNADGEFDYVLNVALDGSEVRFYYGDIDWDFTDFRLMFVALSGKAGVPSWDKISISLRDTGLLLDQSIGGDFPVGGIGPNADRSRPLNFGLVHQLECLVYDEATLVYVHSDTGDRTYADVVRDRGIEVLFTDNGDGTFTLDATPDGNVTADVLSVVDEFLDPTTRRVSDAMDYLVGDRGGLVAGGRYDGAGPTFSVGSDDDYLIGLSIPERTNLKDFLADLVDTGNCFWSITRSGGFTFGTLRPDSIADLGQTPVDIIEDDIDDGSFSVEHGEPQYYLFQAYMSKNWSIQSDLATSLTPDERAIFTRKGLYLIQDAAVGTTYADAPELYDLTLAKSPEIETWLSGATSEDTSDLPSLVTWMETRRFMFLPWLETISLTVGIEFFELELGSVINLTVPRFGLDAGELFQVIAIDMRLTQAKIGLKLIRRRRSLPYPEGWVRVTA